MFSLEVSDYRDTDAREKNNGFLSGYSTTWALFLIEILKEEIKLVVTPNYTF